MGVEKSAGALIFVDSHVNRGNGSHGECCIIHSHSQSAHRNKRLPSELQMHLKTHAHTHNRAKTVALRWAHLQAALVAVQLVFGGSAGWHFWWRAVGGPFTQKQMKLLRRFWTAFQKLCSCGGGGDGAFRVCDRVGGLSETERAVTGKSTNTIPRPRPPPHVPIWRWMCVDARMRTGYRRRRSSERACARITRVRRAKKWRMDGRVGWCGDETAQSGDPANGDQFPEEFAVLS